MESWADDKPRGTEGRCYLSTIISLQWRQIDIMESQNHRWLDCWFKRLLRLTSQPASLALCEGKPPVTDGFPSQRAGNAEAVSIWLRHCGCCIYWNEQAGIAVVSFIVTAPVIGCRTDIPHIQTITMTSLSVWNQRAKWTRDGWSSGNIINRVKCRYKAVQFITISHRALL